MESSLESICYVRLRRTFIRIQVFSYLTASGYCLLPSDHYLVASECLPTVIKAGTGLCVRTTYADNVHIRSELCDPPTRSDNKPQISITVVMVSNKYLLIALQVTGAKTFPRYKTMVRGG